MCSWVILLLWRRWYTSHEVKDMIGMSLETWLPVPVGVCVSLSQCLCLGKYGLLVTLVCVSLCVFVCLCVCLVGGVFMGMFYGCVYGCLSVLRYPIWRHEAITGLLFHFKDEALSSNNTLLPQPPHPHSDTLTATHSLTLPLHTH